jgi:hypothetical protein
MTRFFPVLVVLFAGCQSGDPEVVMDECLVERTQETIRTCTPRSLHPETDPENPEFGRVPCVAIVSGRVNTPFCECTRPGFSPASDAQAELAQSELEAGSLCVDACCDTYCFCVLEQLSGEELAYCQGVGELDFEPGYGPQGWCYVEPDLGIGDPSKVENCPDSQRQLVLFEPPSVVNGSISYIACIGG